MSISEINEEPFQLVDMPDTFPSQNIGEADRAAAETPSVENLAPALSANAITYTSMHELSDMKSRESYSKSVHTNILSARSDYNAGVFGYFGDSDDLDDTARLARLVLIRIKYAAPIVKYAGPEFNTPDGFLTQLIIDCHVATAVEMMRLCQIDPCPRDIITYVCGTFEQSGVSDLAGGKFLGMKYSDQVMSVLSVARAVVAPLWMEYDDMIYAECHRQLDKQALFHVQATYHRRRRIAGCCIAM